VDGPWTVKFKGLAVPGLEGASGTEDLVAIWKTTRGNRFQNYIATFTILDVPVISREWIEDIRRGDPSSKNAPQAWLDFIEKGHYTPLVSEPTTIIRSDEEQLPSNKLGKEILSTVWQYFDHANKEEKKRRAHIFEVFAAKIFQLHDKNVIVDEVTRGSVDGGRDAIGRYTLGLNSDPIFVEYALEAKCYQPGISKDKANRVGVKEVARLISRLRHRQFGVLVTTSTVHKQAYKEVREDKHPVIFISGGDIAEILIKAGFNTKSRVLDYLQSECPLN
jgi:hypothetical protein